MSKTDTDAQITHLYRRLCDMRLPIEAIHDGILAALTWLRHSPAATGDALMAIALAAVEASRRRTRRHQRRHRYVGLMMHLADDSDDSAEID